MLVPLSQETEVSETVSPVVRSLSCFVPLLKEWACHAFDCTKKNLALFKNCVLISGVSFA